MRWLILLCLFSFEIHAQSAVEVFDSTYFIRDTSILLHKTHFRGLSAVNDQVFWVSGTRGTFGRSVDGGKHILLKRIPGYDKSDFRDIEAFDSLHAIVMSSGTPAVILRTADGGYHWDEVYRNEDTAYFLDAMDFWNPARGMIIGDPIHDHFVILATSDSGKSWLQWDTSLTPKAMTGESLFAASGTCLRLDSVYGRVAFVTGGSVARMFEMDMRKRMIRWMPFNLPMIQGNNSSGAFSLCFHGIGFVVTGGDYRTDTLKGQNSCWTANYNYLFNPGNPDVNGYRSCIENLGNTLVACGTSGVDIFRDKQWITIDNGSFNVIRKAKKGKTVFLAGNKGKIGRLN